MGTFYKDIYNLDQKDFKEKLDEAELPDQTKYEVEDEMEEDMSEDDSVLGGDLEIDEDERRMLEMAEAEDFSDEDIENIEEKLLSKKRKKPVKIAMEDELEIEYEREDVVKSKAKK